MNGTQNILVLGGNGFIGSHLVDRLIADGNAVRVFDKYTERYRPPLPKVNYHYGDFGNRGLLSDALRGIQGAIAVFIGKVINDEPIEIWSDGTVSRDYIFIEDLIDGMVLAANTPARSRIFNLGSGVGTSLNELVSMIGVVSGLKVPVLYKAGRGFDVPQIRLDITCARQELGWMPETGIMDGIRSTFDFIRSITVGR